MDGAHRRVGRTVTIIGLAIVALAAGGGAAAAITDPDIEACITAFHGSGPTPPVELFGVPAAIGQCVVANLDYGDGTGTPPFRDPLPDYHICFTGGSRNDDKTVVSRIGPDNGGPAEIVFLHISTAGNTGFFPGSAGRVRILDPRWAVDDIIGGAPVFDHSFSGFGVRVDPSAGLIEWDGRGGCPACGCHENGLGFVARLVRRPIVTSPATGDIVDCDSPPAITWTGSGTPGGFDRFRVQLSTAPDFGEGTTISSPTLTSLSFTPTLSRWQQVCGPAEPTVYIRVQALSTINEIQASSLAVAVCAGPDC